MKNSSRKIDLNQLTEWSHWPKWLLSGASKFDSGYGSGRYEDLLAHRGEGDDFDAIKAAELLNTMPAEYGTKSSVLETCFSMSGQLCVGPVAKILDMAIENIVTALAVCEGTDAAKTVIEFGCGYGYNLHKLGSRAGMGFDVPIWMGGELNAAAVDLARVLFDETRVVQLDMTCGNFDALFDLAPLPVVVFTHHAVEQVRSYKPVLENLRRYRSEIAGVVHCEPILNPFPTNVSLLGELRRAYRQARSYNTDMLETLIAATDVEIHCTQYDVLGANPLNPTGNVIWRFK